MSLGETRGRVAAEEAIWQDVEFGSHTADLPLWEELADAAEGAVLELGAGAGRASLRLARRGTAVVAVDRDAELVAELRRRAEAEDLPVTAVSGDFTALDTIFESILPGDAPALGAAIAPLHVLQQVEPGVRPALIAAIASRLPGGGRFAATLVEEGSLFEEGIGDGPPTPDMREVDGWVYSSEPLWVQVGEEAMTVRRLRERVSPEGEIERGVNDEHLHRLSPELLEEEGAAAGLAPAGRRTISAGPREADSLAVILEVNA